MWGEASPPSDGSYRYKQSVFMSGLSVAALVVEAPVRSGALITAGMALDQGRDVFAVPGPIYAENSRGCNRLIRDGAGVAAEPWDILRDYEAQFPGKLRGQTRPAPELLEKQPGQPTEAAQPVLPSLSLKSAGLTDDQILLLRTLTDRPIQVDDLIELTELPARRVLSALTMLKDGMGDGFVSAGSTGALLSGATLVVKRIRGIRRAALCPQIPVLGGRAVLCDAGANAECTPEYLLQFAFLGSFYARRVMPAPVVAPVPVPAAPPAPAPIPAPAPAAVEKPKSAAGEVAAATAEVTAQIAHTMASGESDYQFPAITLLNENTGSDFTEAGAELRNNARRLSETLKSFGVEATAGEVVHGPTVTRYEFVLDQGVKLSKITNLADDIALALGASGVRIAPIPDKISVVGIEVPNKYVSSVLIRDVVESGTFVSHKSSVSFAVGKDIGGHCIVGDIGKLPHVLIAGTTGSGKSVCTNSLIVSLMYKSGPDKVRFIMLWRRVRS